MIMAVLPRDDGITHVVLTGRLDTPGAEEISERFAEATVARDRPAIVDLSAVDFMASRGINLLLASGKRLAQKGHRLVLLQPQQIVASVIKTARVDVVMPLAHDMQQALDILRGRPVSAGAASVEPPLVAAAAQPASAEPPVAPAVTPGELKLTIKNDLAELRDLNARLARFLEEHHVPHRAAYAVNLAIDELVVNVIRYAYVDDDTHWIDVELAVESEQVVLRITDDGRPFDPRRGPALDLHAEEREVGGLGLILVLDMVDVLKYRRVEDKNWVEVRVHLTPEDAHNASAPAGGAHPPSPGAVS